MNDNQTKFQIPTQQGNQGYATVKDIVLGECLAQQDTTLTKYNVFLKYAIECIKDWNYGSGQSLVTKQFTVDNLGGVPYPVDFVDWSKIGTLNGDEIKVYVVNGNIALIHNDNDCGEPVANGSLPDEKLQYPFFNYYNGIGTEVLYGFGNQRYSDGSFRLDAENRKIQFGSKLAGKKIYMEYISTGVDISQETVVNEYAREVVRNYIQWQWYKRSRNAAQWQVLNAKQDYMDALQKAANRLFQLDVDKVLALTWKQFRLSPKTTIY